MTSIKTTAARALSAVIAIGVAACAEPEPPPPAAAPLTVVKQPPSDVARELMSDRRILLVLRRELDHNPIVAHEGIGVSVDRGVVTLQAQVSTRLAKDTAGEIARVVRGVRSVIDRIEVIPRPRPDHELESVVARALSSDPVLAPQRLSAWAHQGVVQLSGDVDSAAARRIAERDVLAIPGVRDVADDISVRPQRVPMDRVVQEVERVVRNDPWIDASRVELAAPGRVLRMSGWVGSAAERARAETDAREASPPALDLGALRIDAFSDEATMRASPGWSPDDGGIVQALLDTFVADPRVHPFVPNVDVRDRVVVLTGIAPNTAALRAAEQDARNVSGVLDVRTDLKERPAPAVESDQAVLSEVVEAFTRDPRLGRLSIDIQVLRGRVFLRGAVPTAADRMHAIALAASAPGAVDVDDGLVVVPTSIAGR